jgi:hypothetical protein
MPPLSGGALLGTGIFSTFMVTFQVVNLRAAVRTFQFRSSPHIAKVGWKASTLRSPYVH